MGEGKDRGKHDGGRDASGRIPPGAKHPDNPQNTGYQPESGTPVPDEKYAQGDRKPSDDI